MKVKMLQQRKNRKYDIDLSSMYKGKSNNSKTFKSIYNAWKSISRRNGSLKIIVYFGYYNLQMTGRE